MSIFKFSTGQLQYISTNESLYLDLVDVDGYTIESTSIDSCAGATLIGTHSIPAVPVSYQLRGYDIEGSPFTQISDAVITTQLPELQISLINSVIINPNMTTLGRLSLYNARNGPQSLAVNISVTLPPGITVQYPNKVQTFTIPPQEQTEAIITFIGDDSIVHGASLNWTVTATALCYDYEVTNASSLYDILVSKPIKYTTTTTPYSITIQWTPPDITGNIISYTIVVDYGNGTVQENVLNGNQTSFHLTKLAPYQPIFIGISTLSNSDSASVNNIPIRTDEAGNDNCHTVVLFFIT